MCTAITLSDYLAAGQKFHASWEGGKLGADKEQRQHAGYAMAFQALKELTTVAGDLNLDSTMKSLLAETIHTAVKVPPAEHLVANVDYTGLFAIATYLLERSRHQASHSEKVASEMTQSREDMHRSGIL
jgi:hypothetical protein